MLHAIAERLKELPTLVELVPPDAHRVYSLDDVDESHWEVEQLSQHHFRVSGIKLERYLRMTDFTSEEAADRFQRILEGSGVSARLDDIGVQAGDVVHIAEAELIWDQAALDAEAMDEKRRRRTRRQRLQDKFNDGPIQEDEASV